MAMRIISKRALAQFWHKHADAEKALQSWYKIARKAEWGNLSDVRKDYPHADLVGICVIFNIAGNKVRLITKINFGRRIVFIRFVLTHAEYSKEGWKNDCRC